MNKNTIIGFVLMAAVLFGYSWYVQPSEEEIAAQRKQDSIENALRQKAEIAQKNEMKAKKEQAVAAAQGDTTALFYKALNGKNEQLTLKNSKLQLTVNSQGRNISAAKPLGFKDITDDKDLTLFSGKESEIVVTLDVLEAHNLGFRDISSV